MSAALLGWSVLAAQLLLAAAMGCAVLRVLRGEKLKLGGDTKVVDMGGKTMLPGLIDAHGHVMGLGYALIQLDLTGTTSLADLQDRLRRYAQTNPTPVWIVGRGWNQELWADKRFPTAADLDRILAGGPDLVGERPARFMSLPTMPS